MRLKVMSAATRDRLAEAKLTYTEVGATATGLPPRYHHVTRRVILGRGDRLFADAADAVVSWQVQLRAGLTAPASSQTVVAGAFAVLGIGIGPLRIGAPCRVVYTVDQLQRRGFAYGTLAGHPDGGEESFIIEHHDDDTVSFTVATFSRPSTAIAKVAGPGARLIQGWVTSRYLQSLRP
jgi:uncharacterized protein (UPF0548 family)